MVGLLWMSALNIKQVISQPVSYHVLAALVCSKLDKVGTTLFFCAILMTGQLFRKNHKRPYYLLVQLEIFYSKDLSAQTPKQLLFWQSVHSAVRNGATK